MEKDIPNQGIPAQPIQPSSQIKGNKKMYWVGGVIVVVLLLVIVGYKFLKHGDTNQTRHTSTTQTNSTITSHAPTPSSPVNTTSASNSQTINKTGSNNQQLGQDIQTIQGNLNQLGADQTSSDQSIQNQSQDTATQQ